MLHWRGVLERGARGAEARATPGHGLLVQLLRDKEAQAIERLFRLLALQYRGEDFRDIYRGLRSRDARQRASSRELLENLLRPPLRSPMLAIVSEDGGRGAARRARASSTRARPLDYEAVLELILDEGGESLRCIAVAPHRRARPRRAAAAARGARGDRDAASSSRACSSARSRRFRAPRGRLHA